MSNETRECGVCWNVYDPALGDEAWQVEVGTPFEALPEHWRCPRCDSAKERFLPAPAASPPQREPLVVAYEAVSPRMEGLPVYNPALRVEAIGFRDFDGGRLGVVVTPWFMNLVFVPRAGGPALRVREKGVRQLPGGARELIGGRLDGVGPIESCPLFSPMAEFESPERARRTAEALLARVWTPPVAAAPGTPSAARLSRRELLGRWLPGS